MVILTADTLRQAEQMSCSLTGYVKENVVERISVKLDEKSDF